MSPLTEQLVEHDLDDVRSLLELAKQLSDEDYRRPHLPGNTVLGFDGNDESVADVLTHLVFTKEVWLAAIEGTAFHNRIILERMAEYGVPINRVINGGGVPQVVDTPLGRIGANICFDTLFPESTRLLGVQGCEIMLAPFAADPPPGTAAAWANWSLGGSYANWKPTVSASFW